MGKVSSNLITEKDLRATRVNKALEKFFKAHGGKFTIMSPYTVPEHIAYTASISPSDYSRNGNVVVSRKVLKYTPGKGVKTYSTPFFDRDVNRYVANELNKASGHSKEMSEKHFKETSTKPTSNSVIKNSMGNKLKNSKVGNWLKNTKVGSYFADSPFTPMNVALTYKGWTGQANPVAYLVNTYGMGANGGYMPVGEHTLDQLRIQHGQDELSNQGTTVPINPQGTLYLDPELGIVDTQVLEDEDGIRYYKNARTGHFEALDSDAPYKYYNPKKTHFINIDGVFSMPTFNDILNGALSTPKSDTPLPVPPMDYDSDANKPLPPVSADTDEGEIPSGTVVVGPDTEVPAQPVQSVQSAQSVNKPNVASVVKPPRRAPKPKPKPYVEPAVINNTPVVTAPNVPTTVTAPTLSSVASQAIRRNGGFDNYRRESVLSALRAAGGISPAEAVQRGIIPWEALNYI